MNGNEIYNKMFKVINEQGSNYFSGERFISFVKEVDETFPDYSDYIQERQLEGKSTSRKDFFRDIFLSFNDEQRIDFAKRVEKETHSAYSKNSEEFYFLLYGKRPEKMKGDIDRNNVFGNAFSDIFSPLETTQEKSHNMETKVDSRKVFVVHGRNWDARNALFSFLRSIGLHPIEWSEAVRLTGKGSPYIGEILDSAFSNAQAIVVLFTPDDEAKLRDEFITSSDENYERQLTPQARPNVIFEAGMAMGRDSERTILVELGKTRPFSDIYGRHVIRLNNSSQRRQEFAHRLETAKCAVNLVGTDWHTEGNFEINENQEIPSVSLIEEVKVPKTTARNKPDTTRIKRTFSDLDKDEFKNEAFEFITNYFESSLKELENNNSHIKTRFLRVDANHFSATIYVNDSQATVCSIQLNSTDQLFGQGITYSEGQSRNTSINDSLSVTDDGYQLLLKSFGLFSYSNKEEHLEIESAAEYYWNKFIKPLQR